MRPRRTPMSNRVWRLPGGNEDNDLWVTEGRLDNPGDPMHGAPEIRSVWEFTPEERTAIAAGENLSFSVLGPVMPPISMYVTDEPLGARREQEGDGHA